MKNVLQECGLDVIVQAGQTGSCKGELSLNLLLGLHSARLDVRWKMAVTVRKNWNLRGHAGTHGSL